MNQKRGLGSLEQKQAVCALLGLQQSKCYENQPYPRKLSACTHCRLLEDQLKQVTKRSKSMGLQNENLSKMICELEAQNSSLLKQHNKLNIECTELVEKLNEQLEVRDSMIYSYQQKIDELSEILEEKQASGQTKLQGYQQYAVDLEKQIEQRQLRCTAQANCQQQIQKLKASLKQLKQQSTEFERKRQALIRSHESSVSSLEKQVNQLQQLLNIKEGLIRSFSNDNDQLRLQILELKHKQQIEEIASFANASSQPYLGLGDTRLSRQNHELREEIHELKEDNCRRLKELKKLKSFLASRQKEEEQLDRRMCRSKDSSFELQKRDAALAGKMRRQLLNRNVNEQYQVLYNKLVRVYRLCSACNEFTQNLGMNIECEAIGLSKLLLVTDKIIKVLESQQRHPQKQDSPQLTELQKMMISQNLEIQSSPSN